MSYSKRLKQAMCECEISQSELAAAIGKGKSSISQYVAGYNIPKMDVQERIADVLGYTLDWFHEESDDDINTSTTHNISVAEAAKRLNKSEQFVRVALQMGTAPFGFASKSKTKWSYHISPKKLEEYIGT